MNSPEPSSNEQEVRSQDTPLLHSGQAEAERFNDNDLPFQSDDSILPIIGLGGSAGSIPALQEFFARVQPDLGIAYVVVIHLSPDFDSALAQVLGAHTSMPVIQVEGEVEVRPNCVYVIPPSRHLSMQEGRIHLNAPQQVSGQRVAVDLFFRTLAVTHRSKAMAVVLSGMDGDGAIGIKRVKEAGGVTVAQEPTEAEYEGMPRSAIETGMVDWILPVRDIAAKVAEWIHNEERIHLPPAGEIPLPAQETDEEALREVLAFLQARTGHDFQHYKRATVLRRIGRRLQVNSLESLPQYVNFLRTHPGEAGALLQDLLISVTNFFRDPEAFIALDALLPRLFHNRSPNDTVRVWVAGCATGEEAYSLAMLLDEYVETLDAAPEVQIFATDLDEQALRFAREGIYPASIVADVSPERLRRYFVFDQGRYRVKKEVRERVLFAHHNVLQDAPFSRIDLVSCRNLLIYFNRQAQERVFQVFHFALKPGGLIFLGGSEATDDTSLFVVQDRVHRIYEKQAVSRAPLVLPNMAAPTLLRPMEVMRSAYLPPPTNPNSKANKPSLSYSELHLKLLEQAAPPSVLVDANYDIVHLSEHAGQFLRPVGGEVSMNLLSMVAPALRVELRVALFRAVQNGGEVDVPPIVVEIDGQPRRLRLRVRPMQDNEQQNDLSNFVLVIFEDVPLHDNGSDENTTVPTSSSPDQSELVRSLEAELEHLRSYLRASVEQYETSAEELKASNEELQALNEEQRSAAEELETSREEIQAGNEELTTVNSELKAKIEEVGRANSDLQNLMASTDIATVFLNRNLHIKRYTPPAVELFHFIPTDTGRPLGDLKHDFKDEQFIEDATRVLQTLTSLNREIATHDERYFLLRISPYRTVEDYIDGVVLTFVDITERRKAEEAVREREAELARVQRIGGVGGVDIDVASGLTGYRSPEYRRLHGLLLETTHETHEEWLARVHPDDRERAESALREALAGTGERYESEYRIIRPKDGQERWISARLTIERDDSGRPVRLVGAHIDITQRKHAEAALHQSEEQFRALITASSDVIYQMSPDWQEMRQLIGRDFIPDTQEPSVTWLERYIPEKVRPQVWTAIERAIATKSPFELEHQLIQVDGTVGWTFSRAVPLLDEQEEIIAWFGTASNITERKRAEEALRESEGKYRDLFESMDEGYCIIEVMFDAQGKPFDWRYLEVNPAFEENNGLANATGKTILELTPDIEPKWFDIYGRVAQTGEPLRFEEHSPALHRWFSLYAFRVGEPHENRVAVLFNDISERKRQEAQQAFLLQLSDALRPLVNPLEIHATVTEAVLNHFGADRCYYCEIEDDQAIIRRDAARGELPSVVGAYPLDQFPFFKAIMEKGAPLVVEDTSRTDAMDEELRQLCVEMKIISFINIPIIKNQQDAGNLCLTQSSPRKWSNVELHLAEEIAERTWAAVERARAEEAMRASEERLQKAVNIDTVGVIFFNNDIEITDCNEAFVQMSGWTREEIKGGRYSWEEFTPEEFIQPSHQAIAELNASGVCTPYEKEYIRKDGSRFWALFAGKRIGENEIVEFVTDITKQKQAEAAVRDSEERLRIAIEAGDLATWDWDVVRDEVHWNERHFLLFGMKPREGVVHARDFTAHIHSDDYEAVTTSLAQTVEEATSFDAEFRIVREDTGEVRWMNGHGRTTASHNGRATRITGVMYDATERHEAQQVLQRAHEELEQRVQQRTQELARALQQVQALVKRIVTIQEEERGRIARDLHDNLGQYLTAIMMNLQALESQVGSLGGGKRQKGTPDLATLRSLVDGLMRAAHVQAVELRPPALDQMGLEAAVEQYIRDWQENTGIEVDFQAIGWQDRRIDPMIETTLYRIVQEALTNVARHAEPSMVSVVLELNPQSASAIIEDNGRGFDTEQQTARLGLVGMRERLVIVGGTLNIESSPDQGTTVFARVALSSSGDGD